MKKKYSFFMALMFCFLLGFQTPSFAGGVIIIDGDEGSGTKTQSCSCQHSSCSSDKSGDKNEKSGNSYRPMIIIRIFGMVFYF